MIKTTRSRIGVLLAFAVLGASCVNNSGPSAPNPAGPSTSAATLQEFETIRDVSYWDDDLRHTLDVYLPTSAEKPLPTIMAIHGGGFRARSKSLYGEIGPHYADNGYAFVAINYRLAPGSTYPAQVEDSLCALAWIHQNAAEYGFDTDRVIVWGGSAGGYLAAMVATANDPSVYLGNCPHKYPESGATDAAIVFYGLFDFTNVDDLPENEVFALARFWGATYDEIPADRLEEMSPIVQIDGTEPPFLLLHGTADATIPSVTSERFAAALERAGVSVELVLIPEAGHAFELEPLTGDRMTKAFREIDDFFDRSLER